MIKITNKSNEKLAFETDMNVSLANAIRRSASYIPILAVDSLEISKNDSALYDELIAHRVGLVPLQNEKLKLASECDCGKEEGCSKCSIKFKLSAKGPCTVYSTDMSPKDNILYKMPITILNKDQELEFVAVAKMGRAIEHAKYSPGLIFYRYSEDLEKEQNDESFREMVEESKKKDDKPITMIIESWGQIPAKEIFTQSVEILNEEIKDLLKELK
jgi:DNA-directed RNA polymerase subunit D